jgi:hypothetical protein
VRAAPGKVHTLHVNSIHVDGSKKNTWIVFTHTHGQHFDINASLHRQLRAGSNYICHVQGLKLLSCRR